MLLWSITGFWILVKPLHLRSLLSKLMRCTENCNTCSQHWSTERAQFSATTPDCKSHNQRFENGMNGLPSFASPDCLPTDYHLKHLNNFMFPQPEGGRKCFPRVHWILKHAFLCYRNKQIFLIGKNVLIVMLIFINKGVFEPSYNDSKFKIWNCNYFYTNLRNLHFLAKEEKCKAYDKAQRSCNQRATLSSSRDTMIFQVLHSRVKLSQQALIQGMLNHRMNNALDNFTPERSSSCGCFS